MKKLIILKKLFILTSLVLFFSVGSIQYNNQSSDFNYTIDCILGPNK